MNRAPEGDALRLQACIDDELELTQRLEFEQRLRSDPALRAEVEAGRLLRQVVREGADYHAAPPALQQRIATLVATPAAPPHARATPPRWRWDWLSAGAGAGVAAALALLVNAGGVLRPDADASLSDAVLASHVRSTLGTQLVDVASSDRHTVKPWFAGHLDYAPPVQELSLPGSTFVGGRVDYLGGRPVAALVYRQGPHIVNTYVWPAPGADLGVHTQSERGYRLAQWRHAGMQHWVVSDVDRETFDAIVRAVMRADSEP